MCVYMFAGWSVCGTSIYIFPCTVRYNSTQKLNYNEIATVFESLECRPVAS